MSQPVISYISTVYNKAAYLAETVDILRKQTGLKGHPVEFVFADDRSSDQSVEILQGMASEDPRIKVIENQDNQGPAIRINQAANAATGRFLLPLDADDMLPGNASRFQLDLAERENVSLIFGRSRRNKGNPNIPIDSQVSLHHDALAFCARKQVVHMGFLVNRQLWQRSGGADTNIFIQDQSVPLRLAAAADRLAWVDEVIYWLRPAEGGNLSANVIQQHHDRFLSARDLLGRRDITQTARKALLRQLSSTIWKLRRDSGVPVPHLSASFLQYLLNRVVAAGPSDTILDRTASMLANLPGVRRPEKTTKQGDS